MFDSASYESRAFHLDKGDILVVYSDGLTDARKPAGRNVRRGKTAGNHSARGAPREVARSSSSFLKAIEEFTQGMPQTDDITFVVVEKCQ